MALVEDREGKGDVHRTHRVHRAHGHMSGLDATQPLQLGLRRVDLGENTPRTSDE